MKKHIVNHELERRFHLNVPMFITYLATSVFGSATSSARITEIEQWYLSTEKPTLRIRKSTPVGGSNHPVSYYEQTVKGKKTKNGCPEIEFSLQAEHAQAMIELAVYPVIAKTRYEVEVEEFICEVDIFHDARLTAHHCVEIEFRPGLSGDDPAVWNEALDVFLAGSKRPAWLGQEITKPSHHGSYSKSKRPAWVGDVVTPLGQSNRDLARFLWQAENEGAPRSKKAGRCADDDEEGNLY